MRTEASTANYGNQLVKVLDQLTMHLVTTPLEPRRVRLYQVFKEL